MKRHVRRGSRPSAAAPERRTHRRWGLGPLRQAFPSLVRRAALHALDSTWLPIVALVLAVLAFVAAGRSVPRVAETNLPTPGVSVAENPIRLAHPTFAADGRYRVTATRARPSAATPPEARLRVQLHTEGRSRLVSVQEEDSRFPRLQLVPHLGWIDLGRFPPTAARKLVTVRALLGGSFAFTSPNVPMGDAALRVTVAAESSPEAIVAVRSLRYRVIELRSAGVRESLARFLFFPTRGWITPVAAGLALAGLVVGWRSQRSGRTGRGAAVLAAAVLALHAALLPPLMGGDETSHSAVLESSLLPHEDVRHFYPGSLSVVAEAMEVERTQYRGDESLPVDGRESRELLTAVLDDDLLDEAARKGPLPPRGYVIEAEARAPAYYAAATALTRPFARSAVVDRLAAYRFVGVGLVALFVALAGATAIASGAGRWLAGAAGLVLLLPYSVAVVASTSNYSPAVGFGLLGATGIVAGIAGSSARGRAAALGVGLAAYALGIPFWSDFTLGLGILLALLPLLGAMAIVQPGRGGPGRAGLLLGGLVLLAGIGLASSGAPVVARLVAGLPRARVALDTLFRPEVQARLPYAGAPLVLFLAGLVYIRVVSMASKGRARSLARRASAFLAVLVVAGAAALPWTGVSYGYVQTPRTEQLSHFLRSLLSNALSWDQDLLGWKLWWGVFGWADTFSSPLVYAFARWGLTFLVVASPVLVLPYVRRRPQQAALLLAVSCFGLTTIAVSFLIRLNSSVFPYGRFFLPFFPLVALPFLAMLRAPGRLQTLRGVFGVAVLFHIWVAVYTLGTRYCFGK